jgi:hypothetical protein
MPFPSVQTKIRGKDPPSGKGEAGRGLLYFRLYNRFYFLRVP